MNSFFFFFKKHTSISEITKKKKKKHYANHSKNTWVTYKKKKKNLLQEKFDKVIYEKNIASLKDTRILQFVEKKKLQKQMCLETEFIRLWRVRQTICERIVLNWKQTPTS